MGGRRGWPQEAGALSTVERGCGSDEVGGGEGAQAFHCRDWQPGRVDESRVLPAPLPPGDSTILRASHFLRLHSITKRSGSAAPAAAASRPR